jgi:hypothetical protein
MHLLVNSLKTFLSEEMIAHLYRMDPDELMEESAEEAARRDELLAMYQSSKQALEIIKNVNVKAEPLPPPVENDLQVGHGLDADGIVNGVPPSLANTLPSKQWLIDTLHIGLCPTPPWCLWWS